MAAPYPPQGEQSPHTERPLKIYAEQYHVAGPLPIGATADIVEPMFLNGEPRVYVGGQVHLLVEGEWVISNRYTGQPTEVISAEEFAERFGPAPQEETTP